MWSVFAISIFSLFPLRKNSEEWRENVQVTEVMEMVSLCNTFSFARHYANTHAFVPYGYQLIAKTKETPLLNIVQIFKKENTLALVFRGTIDETNSWLENAHFMQIPAKESLSIDGKNYIFNFSSKPGAAVHSGYVLASAFIWKELKNHLSADFLKSVDRIVLTGHSQGGALAQLFLAQMDIDPKFKNIDLRSYSFGSPRVGNQIFTDDFNQRFNSGNKALRFVNPDDIVCSLPVVNKQFDISIKGFETTIDLENMNTLFQFGKHLLPDKYRDNIDKVVVNTLYFAEKMIKDRVGEVVFPEWSPTIFYGETGVMITLLPQPYPSYFKESKANGMMGKLQSVYAKFEREATFYQHSIFTYYNAVYKHYKPKHFRRVRLKELPQKML